MKKDILVIDDDVDTINLIRHIAETTGHEIVDALSTTEALQILKERDFQLIFLDLKMPEYSGHDFLNLYNSIFPERDTPIIVISGDKSEHAYKQVMAQGARDFIPKPIINKLRLLRIIEDHCSSDDDSED